MSLIAVPGWRTRVEIEADRGAPVELPDDAAITIRISNPYGTGEMDAVIRRTASGEWYATALVAPPQLGVGSPWGTWATAADLPDYESARAWVASKGILL